MNARYVVAAGLFALGCASADAQQTQTGLVRLKDSVPHITTFGSAKAEVVPDLADVTTGVTNENKSADAATEATAKAAEAIIADLKKQGVDPKDIRTSFTLETKYDVVKNDKGAEISRTLRGYEAFEQIYIHLRDVKKAGVLARAMIANGANTFGGIVFSYSKEKQQNRELRADAIRDALTQAKASTDAVGLKLGRVLQIGGDDDGSFGQADLPSRRGLRTATYVPLEPGVQTLTEVVMVVWEIEGKAP